MSYQIADEPHATPFSAYVVRPNAPLLALMLCGAWLAWPWFAFNALALGSPTKRRELALCLAAVVGTAVLGAIVIALWRGDVLGRTGLRFALLGITTWKLVCAYNITLLQARTFHVYEYYGAPVRSARIPLVSGMYLRRLVIDLVDDPLWIIIVTGLALHTVVISLCAHPLWTILAGPGL